LTDIVEILGVSYNPNIIEKTGLPETIELFDFYIPLISAKYLSSPLGREIEIFFQSRDGKAENFFPVLLSECDYQITSRS
jgi:hypothetical protein